MSQDYYLWLVWFHRLTGGITLLGAEQINDPAIGAKRWPFVRSYKSTFLILYSIPMCGHTFFYLWKGVTSQLPGSTSPLTRILFHLEVRYLSIFHVFLAVICGNLFTARYGCMIRALRHINRLIHDCGRCHKMLLDSRESFFVTHLLPIYHISFLLIAIAFNVLIYYTTFPPLINNGDAQAILSIVAGYVSAPAQFWQVFNIVIYFTIYMSLTCRKFCRLLLAVPDSDRKQFVFKELYKLYESLWGTFELLNRGMEVQLFFGVPYGVFGVMTQCMVAIDRFRLGQSSQQLDNLLITLSAEMSIYFFLFGLACIANSWLDKQKNCIHATLHSSGILELVSDEDFRWIEAFNATRNRQMAFSAFGLFTMDNALLLSVIGLTVTYCVILIQSN